MLFIRSIPKELKLSPIVWYIPICLALGIYSYTFVDLNLTLSSNALYLSIQQTLTYFGYYQRSLSSLIYTLLVCILVTAYIAMLLRLRMHKAEKKEWVFLCLIGVLLLLSYPIFSYDLFNYIFNAKMVLVYGANPHIHAAAEFSNDVWLRFMHNVHTPAPYAYGWTLLSLIPGIVTLTKIFTLSLLTMKVWLFVLWLGTLYVLQKIINERYPHEQWRFWLFALSPLILIETLIVGHNDLAMMLPALISFLFLMRSKRLPDSQFWLSIIFLGISIGIKYATVVLLPLWLLKYYKKDFDIAGIGAILLFLVPFTRWDQLHSWYLVWAITFAVLAKNRIYTALFVSLSIGALLRYIPFISTGSWDNIYWLRNIIWIASLVSLPFLYNLIKGIDRKQKLSSD